MRVLIIITKNNDIKDINDKNKGNQNFEEIEDFNK